MSSETVECNHPESHLTRQPSFKPGYWFLECRCGWAFTVADSVVNKNIAVSPAKAEAKPEAACPYEHSTVLCNKCGWSPNAMPEAGTMPPSDTPEFDAAHPEDARRIAGIPRPFPNPSPKSSNLNDHVTLTYIADDLERHARICPSAGDWMADAHRDLRAIASRIRIAPTPAVNTPASIMASDALAEQVGRHVAADSIKKVADDLMALAPNSLANVAFVARLRAIATKQEELQDRMTALEDENEAIMAESAKPHPKAAEVAEKLETWMDGHCGDGAKSRADFFTLIAEVRRLQPTREMPEAVAGLASVCDEIVKDDSLGLHGSQRELIVQCVAAVRAHYATPSPAPDAVPVVRTEADRQRMADRVRDELMTRVLRRLDALEAKGTK